MVRVEFQQSAQSLLNMFFSLQLKPPTVVPGSALLGGPHATNLLKRLHELLEWGSLGTPTARAFGWRELLEWGSLGTPTAGGFRLAAVVLPTAESTPS